jgi:hypothetical protein
MIRWMLLLATSATACGAADIRPFPLRDPMWHDHDLASVSIRCRREPSKKDPAHVACAPKSYVSPLYWDGVDSLIFRPLSEALGLMTSGEAVNVNSMDEVPDSAWFQNRLGRGWMTTDEVRDGACTPELILDPENAPDGSGVIDKGKDEGSTGGFRMVVPGKGKYMVKTEDSDDHPERQSAASAIGAAAYYAVGYNAACEQVLYIRPSVLKLTPGLVVRGNFAPDAPFDKRALDRLLAKSTHRGDLVRVGASAWIPGHVLGPYRYEGIRHDDPNDVVPHENRRDLRGMRLIAAWLGRFDAREANTIDTWMADDARRPDSSPGHIVHYQLDTSEMLGGDWSVIGFNEVSKRFGSSYIIDWGDVGQDFITLGIPRRPWDDVQAVKGRELFGYYTVAGFDAEGWKDEYPNAAFSRMSERDGAWMARILSRFTPEMVRALAELGRFTDPTNTTYLASVLQGRLDRILERYLLRLSPIADVHLVSPTRICAVDLAEQRRLRDPTAFHYRAATHRGAPLAVTRQGSSVCVDLVHDGYRYVVVDIEDGVARGKLLVHLYDLGNDGFKVVGLERPSP